MDCAAGTNAIKITPQGCRPVSEDKCASGFMAPAENVTFPKDPLETCCKCREGEACEYCLDETCTDEEKKLYVTAEDCFARTILTTSTVDEPPAKAPGASMWPAYVVAMIVLIVSFIVFLRQSR